MPPGERGDAQDVNNLPSGKGHIDKLLPTFGEMKLFLLLLHIITCYDMVWFSLYVVPNP